MNSTAIYMYWLHVTLIYVYLFLPQSGRFRGLTMGFPPLPQRSSARRSFGRSKRLSHARSLDDLEVCTQTSTQYHIQYTVQTSVSVWPLDTVTFKPHVHHPSLIIATHAHHTCSHDTSSPFLMSLWQQTHSRGLNHLIEGAKIAATRYTI